MSAVESPEVVGAAGGHHRGVRAALGPLVLLAALTLGIVAGEARGASPATPALAVGVTLAAVALLLRTRVGLAIGAVALALLGAAAMQRALDGLEHSQLRVPIAGYRSRVVSVTLVDDPGGTQFAADALARVEGFGRTVVVVARGDAAGRLRILAAGDRAELDGFFRPLSRFEARLRWRHAVGAFELTTLRAFAGPSSPLVRVANALRGLVLDGTASAPPTERALVAGLLLGDTRAIPPATVAEFRDSGLTHHLAVSGENVAFVLALAAPLLRRLRLRARFATGLILLVLFGTMTRWEPSVLRAVVMAGCVMLAQVAGRPTAGVRVLALAAGSLLLADPFLIHSVGFALSCGATAGIAVLASPIAARLPISPPLRGPLAVTAAAQLGVAPVMLPVWGAMPAAALPANLLAAPLVGPITIWGLGAGVAGALVRPSVPAVAALLQVPTTMLVRALEGVASAGASVPLEIDTAAALGLVAVALGVAGVLSSPRARRGQSTRLDGDAPVPRR